MTINEKIIRKLEYTYRREFPEILRNYLLCKYSEEPFPYHFSEQDLYENIRKDIHKFDEGSLDVEVKSNAECWIEERKYLRDLCVEKLSEIRKLTDYIEELENILLSQGIESTRMTKRRNESQTDSVPF